MDSDHIETVPPHRLRDYALYMQGAMTAMMKARDCFMPYIKGENAVYARAEFDLYLDSMRNMERFLTGDRIGYRNHDRKGNRLVKCEAYFVELENGKQKHSITKQKQ